VARIRSIKPEIWMSPQVMNLSAHARLLFLGLITQSDDAGRGSADPRRLKAAIFGGDDVTSSDVRRWLDEVSAQRLAVVYESVDHGILYELPSWKSHQSIDRPRPSAYPAAPIDPKPPTRPRTLDDGSTNDRRGSEGSEGIGSEGIGGDRSVMRARDPEPDPDAVIVSEFAAIRAGFPEAPRANWIAAEKAARQLVAARLATWPGLREAVARYAAYCAATGRLVMNPCHFFAAEDQPWAQPWTLPKSKADARFEGNVAVLDQFIAEGRKS
jgi:hypothetical protein